MDAGTDFENQWIHGIGRHAGMDVVMIPGDENSFKITGKADLERFAGLVKGKGIVEGSAW